MRDVINGPKKGGQEPTAIIDPNNDNLIVSNEEFLLHIVWTASQNDLMMSQWLKG